MKGKLIRRLILVTLATVGIAALLVGLSVVFLNYLVDFWWFDSLGYEFYYLLRLFYRYLIFALIALVFFLVFFLNFRIALRYLGSASPSAASKKYQRYQKLVSAFRRGSSWLYNPLALVLAVLIALPLFRQWQGFLFYVFGPMPASPILCTVKTSPTTSFPIQYIPSSSVACSLPFSSSSSDLP